MNIKKIAAGFLAASVGTAAFAASVGAYNTQIMFADGSWSINSMGDLDLLEECNNVTADVTADGTYTVSFGEVLFQDGDEDYGAAEGATVFCVDIEGLAEARGAGKGAAAYDALDKDAKAADKMQVAKDAGINVTDVKVTITDPDGKTTDIAVDQSKILFGDLEGNGKIRIEIYNEYGDTKNDPPINKADITNAVTVAATFTISGVAGDAANDEGDKAAPADDEGDKAPADNNAAGDTNQPVADKNNADTGVEGVAVVAGLAVIAAGAVVVAKKRK